MEFDGSHANGGGQVAIAFTTGIEPHVADDGIAFTLTQPSKSGGGQPQAVSALSAVRRLTPRECERLQGFPDDYTLVPFRKKPAADGPRYRALGNSMAVPVMSFIGKRIQMVEDLCGPHD
jgi:DNA (cytosine-5)-methyltransferase 1